MINNNIEMRILIKGKPITEYPHNGQLYVEGRNGSNFEIELVNRNSFQVEAIISVDGLSVTDGKDAGPNSSGYLLKAYETLRIPGWKLDSEAVAAFQFAGSRQSYSAQSTGSARNTGVVGVMAYREKPTYYAGWSSPINAFPASGGATWSGGGYNIGGLATLNSCMAVNTCDNLSVGASAMSCSTASLSSAKGLTRSASGSALSRKTAVAAAATEPVKQTLGTAFGEKQDFRTQEVAFERGDLLAMSVIYYDDARGLRDRGIVMERRTSRSRAETPSAFPAMGCTPPAGWRG